MPALVRLRHQAFDISPLYLAFVVTEHVFCRPVEALDVSLTVDNDNGIDCCLHQGIEGADDFVVWVGAHQLINLWVSC